ncbi:20463_t:CDS:1, partial [Racocetra persica]
KQDLISKSKEFANVLKCAQSLIEIDNNESNIPSPSSETIELYLKCFDLVFTRASTILNNSSYFSNTINLIPYFDLFNHKDEQHTYVKISNENENENSQFDLLITPLLGKQITLTKNTQIFLSYNESEDY